MRYTRDTLQDMTRPLKAWLAKNKANPYPSKGQKEELASQSKMTLTQVSNWFANARRRLKSTPGEGRSSGSHSSESSHGDQPASESGDQPVGSTGNQRMDVSDDSAWESGDDVEGENSPRNSPDKKPTDAGLPEPSHPSDNHRQSTNATVPSFESCCTGQEMYETFTRHIENALRKELTAPDASASTACNGGPEPMDVSHTHSVPTSTLPQQPGEGATVSAPLFSAHLALPVLSLNPMSSLPSSLSPQGPNTLSSHLSRIAGYLVAGTLPPHMQQEALQHLVLMQAHAALAAASQASSSQSSPSNQTTPSRPLLSNPVVGNQLPSNPLAFNQAHLSSSEAQLLGNQQLFPASHAQILPANSVSPVTPKLPLDALATLQKHIKDSQRFSQEAVPMSTPSTHASTFQHTTDASLRHLETLQMPHSEAMWRPDQSSSPHGSDRACPSPGPKYKHTLLQRYLQGESATPTGDLNTAGTLPSPTIPTSAAPLDLRMRTRQPSGSLGSQEYEDISECGGDDDMTQMTQAVQSHDAVVTEDVVGAVAQRWKELNPEPAPQQLDQDGEDLMNKELSAIFTLASLASSRGAPHT